MSHLGINNSTPEPNLESLPPPKPPSKFTIFFNSIKEFFTSLGSQFRQFSVKKILESSAKVQSAAQNVQWAIEAPPESPASSGTIEKKTLIEGLKFIGIKNVEKCAKKILEEISQGKKLYILADQSVTTEKPELGAPHLAIARIAFEKREEGSHLEPVLIHKVEDAQKPMGIEKTFKKAFFLDSKNSGPIARLTSAIGEAEISAISQNKTVIRSPEDLKSARHTSADEEFTIGQELCRTAGAMADIYFSVHQRKMVENLTPAQVQLNNRQKIKAGVLYTRLETGGTLDSYLEKHSTSLKDDEKLFMAYHMLKAIQPVHQAGYIHGDIKYENMLVRMVDNEPVVLLADFGHTCTIKSKGVRGTQANWHARYKDAYSLKENIERRSMLLQEMHVPSFDMHAIGQTILDLFVKGKKKGDRVVIQPLQNDELKKLLRDFCEKKLMVPATSIAAMLPSSITADEAIGAFEEQFPNIKEKWEKRFHKELAASRAGGTVA